MSTNRRKVTIYDSIVADPLTFGSGLAVVQDSSTTTAGNIRYNNTDNTLEVVGTSDSTYHSLTLRPVMIKQFGSAVSVANNTLVELDLTNSLTYAKRTPTPVSGGSFSHIQPSGLTTDPAGKTVLVTVTGEWAANATGVRRIFVTCYNENGIGEQSPYLNHWFDINPQSSGTTWQSASCVITFPEQIASVDAGGFAVTLLQTSGGALNFSNARVTVTTL